MKPCPSCSAPVRPDSTFCTKCGFRTESNATVDGQIGASLPTGQFAAGAVVDGKYQVVNILGEGGMGMVYRAKSIHTDVDVVIKAVRPEIAHRADIRERTLAEGKALARIDHPNVVQLKAVVVTEKELLLVMQFIEGEDLEARITRHAQKQQPMELHEALEIFRQILKGVSAAHAEGVIHRDIKPANVLIRAKDQMVKVTDFGIAKPEEDAQSGKGQTKGIIGTVNYMSPEQVTGRRDLDRRVDIYALGIMLFEMLTGMLPFDADNTYEILKMHVDDPLPSATVGRPHLPRQLDGVLQKACAKDRDHRYASCEEFLAALEGMEEAVSGAAPTAMGDAVNRTIPEAPSMTPAGYAQTPYPPQAHFQAPHPTPSPMMAAQFVNAVAQGHQTMPSAGPPITQPTPYGPPPGYAPAMSRPGTITGQAAELPASRTSGGKGWVVPVILASVLASGITVALVAGVGPFGDDDSEEVASLTDDDSKKKKKKKKAEPAASASAASSATETSPLDAIAGRWGIGTNQYDAVVSGGRIELRIVAITANLIKQGYREGDVRILLHPIDGEEKAFLVEERLRPLPPAGAAYDPSDDNARATCIAVWKDAKGDPLKARLLADDQLEVEVAKIEPSAGNFVVAGTKVLSCKGLESLGAAKTIAKLTRQ